MDPNQYYESLMQQGYNSNDAIHFTKQYYPEFSGPAQGMSMMTPPPPGSMEMGGLAAGGFGVPTAGMAATTGITAAATTGGGMSMGTIAVVSVLVLGGIGTGGYFLYDYLTEPDFYGEVYWTEGGIAYIFEDDEMTIGFAQIDGSCEAYQNEDEEVEKKNGICAVKSYYDDYSVEEKGDYYKVCLEWDGEGEECINLYPLEQGLILKQFTMCYVYVSDIDAPPNSLYDTEGFENEMTMWRDEWKDVAEEIKNDDDAPKSCDYDYFGNSESSELYDYQFSERDAVGQMSEASGDDLVHIVMTGGDDLSWAVLKVSIVVDDGRSYSCDEAGSADSTSDCTYATDDDNYWSVSEEITISEGSSVDLCDGSNGGCYVDIAITKIGVGNEDDRILGVVNAYAEA